MYNACIHPCVYCYKLSIFADKNYQPVKLKIVLQCEICHNLQLLSSYLMRRHLKWFDGTSARYPTDWRGRVYGEFKDESFMLAISSVEIVTYQCTRKSELLVSSSGIFGSMQKEMCAMQIVKEARCLLSGVSDDTYTIAELPITRWRNAMLYFTEIQCSQFHNWNALGYVFKE